MNKAKKKNIKKIQNAVYCSLTFKVTHRALDNVNKHRTLDNINLICMNRRG